MTNHIEVWYDETSGDGEPEYCVSLCADDGEEIRLLSTHANRGDAEEAGRVSAAEGGMAVLYRETTGATANL